ncbi:MAG: RNA polymerase sigma factor [Planctomycetota bacterium]
MLSDQELRRFREGDRSVCEDIVQDHYEQIYRFLFHRTLDAHLAADLTQETFAAAWRSMRSFRGTSSVSTWLHQIAYRKQIDEARNRQRREQSQEQRASHWNEENGTEPALQTILKDERSRHLYRAIQELNPRERDVVLLRFFQGLSTRETAEIMNEPTGTTQWRTSQALRQLRRLLSIEDFYELRSS